MSIGLSERVQNLLPAIRSLAELVHKRGVPTQADLQSLLFSLGMEYDSEAFSMFEGWGLALATVRGEATNNDIECATHALILRSVPKAYAVLAISLVTGRLPHISIAGTDSGRPIQSSHTSVYFGELHPHQTAEATLSVTGGPGRVEFSSDMLSVRPDSFGPERTSLTITLKGGTVGQLLWDKLVLQGQHEHVSVDITALWLQSPTGAPSKSANTSGRLESGYEEESWKQSKATVDGCLDYLARYPEGVHANEARLNMQLLLDEQMWREACSERTIEAYERYLSSAYGDVHSAQAHEAIALLRQDASQPSTSAERRVTSESTSDAMPTSPSTPETADTTTMNQRESNRDSRVTEVVDADILTPFHERAAWLDAKRQKTSRAYKKYLIAFPKGPNAPKARHELAVALRRMLLSDLRNSELRWQYLTHRSEALRQLDIDYKTGEHLMHLQEVLRSGDAIFSMSASALTLIALSVLAHLCALIQYYPVPTTLFVGIISALSGFLVFIERRNNRTHSLEMIHFIQEEIGPINVGYCPSTENDYEAIRRAYLAMQTQFSQLVDDIKALEDENAITLGQRAIPFGTQHDKWIRLMSQMQLGDDLWEYADGKRCGYCVARDGNVVARIVLIGPVRRRR